MYNRETILCLKQHKVQRDHNLCAKECSLSGTVAGSNYTRTRDSCKRWELGKSWGNQAYVCWTTINEWRLRKYPEGCFEFQKTFLQCWMLAKCSRALGKPCPLMPEWFSAVRELALFRAEVNWLKVNKHSMWGIGQGYGPCLLLMAMTPRIFCINVPLTDQIASSIDSIKILPAQYFRRNIHWHATVSQAL